MARLTKAKQRIRNKRSIGSFQREISMKISIFFFRIYAHQNDATDSTSGDAAAAAPTLNLSSQNATTTEAAAEANSLKCEE